MTVPTPDGQRIVPVGPADSYQTYAVRAPIQTHWRPATCSEVECQAWAYGWMTRIDVTSDLGARQAKYIREQSGRTYVAQGPDAAGILTFTFPAGQRCFAGHRVRLERDATYVRRPGDWRGGTGRTIRFRDAQDWVDDFGEHQQRIADQREKG